MSSPAHQTINVDPITAGASAVAGGVTIKMTTLMWARWATIAIRHLETAKDALERLQAEPDSSKWSPADLDADAESPMQSIAASAFAAEALWKRLQQVLADQHAEPSLKGSRGDQERAARIIGAATTAATPTLRSDLAWLYDERSDLVHYRKEGSRPTKPHPVLSTNVSHEAARFSVAAAERAVTILLSCLRACIRNPSPSTRSWAQGCTAVLDLLEQHAARLGL